MELPVKEPGLDSVRQQTLPLSSVESAIKNTGVYVRVRFQLGWDAKEERAPRIRKADGTALRGYWLADGGGLVVGNCYWQELVGGVLAHLLRAPRVAQYHVRDFSASSWSSERLHVRTCRRADDKFLSAGRMPTPPEHI
jgi:hypothetical protein